MVTDAAPVDAVFDKRQVLELTTRLITLQVERVVWLREWEVEAETPLRELGLALRTLAQHLGRAERLIDELESEETAEKEDIGGHPAQRTPHQLYADMSDMQAKGAAVTNVRR